jgi:Pyruvate/2-oxoacid:ferredoxin oxidoreductase delta subunit
MSRRGFLGLAPREAPREEARRGFSLDAFYGARDASSATSLPRFAVRAPADPIETSRVGVPDVGRLERPAAGASPARARRAIDGVLAIRPGACLAWQRSFCTVCVERCPEPGAIAVDQGKPRVVPERCTGCGVCVEVCPAPLQAFEIRPREP